MTYDKKRPRYDKDLNDKIIRYFKISETIRTLSNSEFTVIDGLLENLMKEHAYLENYLKIMNVEVKQ